MDDTGREDKAETGGNVRFLSIESGDGSRVKPRELLTDTLREVNSTAPISLCGKMVVIALDDSDDLYNVYRRAADLSCSELLALLEFVKHDVLRQMNGDY